jgi:hypothetical protein
MTAARHGAGLLALLLAPGAEVAAAPEAAEMKPSALRQLLDAPVLFTRRHSYTGIHIYDTCYKWPPGGGGIYVLENPREPRSAWRIRTVVDAGTPGGPGHGVYTHPELNWEADRLLFCFKGSPDGDTVIYEIGVDGRGLRRVEQNRPGCVAYQGHHRGHHDLAPAYLPDGRIVFLSTRQSGLVPCNNTGVSVLHVMNADGSDAHAISVNFVNEFDPAVLPDGRILYGRWEYVDKNALTIQSLWTVHPDGSQETALYANNMVFPEALLDARPVPGSGLLCATLAKHNGPPRGSIAFLDPTVGKNDPRALRNLEHPDNPTHDRGESCEPWPLSDRAVLFSGRGPGGTRNRLEILGRDGRREVLLEDSAICLHSPMLVKPRARPAVLPDRVDRSALSGRLLVREVHRGLEGVARGEVRWLRVLEETSRVNGSTMGGSPFNQTFLVSSALAFSAKNYLGLVPVAEDGSAYFEVPAGRALYLQALDGEHRLVQSMRTFVQAAPGVTRSCVGCHEPENATPSAAYTAPAASAARPPSRPQPESWGQGPLDYPTRVQPVLDRHCVRCHGGEEGFAAGLDLSGGWTEHFNISYENLTNRRHTQLVAHWIAGIDCMNGTAHHSSRLFPPRSHGSGAAPLAQLLVDGHGGRIPHLTRPERDLLMAWMDGNGLYHGTWDSTPTGSALRLWKPLREALQAEMGRQGCQRCHDPRGPAGFENDWVNLERPEWSRLLRAPLAPGGPGLGVALCRERRAGIHGPRNRLLVSGYAHAVKPAEQFPRRDWPPADGGEAAWIGFDRDDHPGRLALLDLLQEARRSALAEGRVDLPGAPAIAGQFRPGAPVLGHPSLPADLRVTATPAGARLLTWSASAAIDGRALEIHRGATPDFQPGAHTRIATTTNTAYLDLPPDGAAHYALVPADRAASGILRPRPAESP